MSNVPTVGIAPFFVASGDDVTVNQMTAGSQYNAHATALSDGRYLVTWLSQSGTGHSRVTAQLFAADGTPVGSEFGVGSPDGVEQAWPSVAADQNGGFVVSWVTHQYGISHKVSAQSYNAAGATVGAEIVVATLAPSASSAAHAQIAVTADGGFVVTYDTLTDYQTGEVYARMYNAGGVAAGASFQVNSFTADTQWDPKIAALDGGGFLVTWQSILQDGADGGIYGQRYNAAGTALGGEFRVNTGTAFHESGGEATKLVGGGFVITWSSYDISGGTASKGIYAQVYAANGSTVGGPQLLDSGFNGGAGHNATEPVVTALADGGFVAGWHAYTNAPNTYGEIFVREYNADGTPRGAAVQANISVPGYVDVRYPQSIIVAEDGDVMIFWQAGHSATPTHEDIYAQRYSTAAHATEQVSLALEQSITVGDDAGSNTVTVTLSVDYGLLNIANAGSGVTATGNGTGSIVLTGTVDQLNTLLAGGPSSKLSYFADIDAPPSTATLTVLVRDADNQTSSATTHISITGTPELATAHADAASTNEVTVTAGNLFADNGSGADTSTGGQALIVSAINGVSGSVGTTITLASGALLTVQSDGSYVYDPNGKFEALGAAGSGASNLSAQDSFTYTLVNGNTAAVTLTITGVDNNDVLLGTPLDDVIRGGAGSDTIFGGDGADRIEGGTGADAMTGGTGNDSYVVDDAGDTVFEAGGEGTDRVATTVSWVMAAGQEIEQLTVANVASTNAVNLTGNEFANKLAGNDGANTLNGGGGNDKLAGAGGNDILDGGAGADQMQGGTGSDSYIVDNAGDTVFEANSGGVDYDTVMATVSWTLAAGQEVERLRAGPGTDPINLTGNEFAQKIQGNDGANILLGGGGNDVIVAAGGDDTLKGGTGLDKLTGGLGADTFVFEHGGQMDQIVDFTTGTDKADLTAFGLTWQDVQGAMTESNGNTILTLGGGDSVVFAGVAKASLSASDFLLSGNILSDTLQSPRAIADATTVAVNAMPSDVVFNNDRTLMYVATQTGSIDVIETATGTVLHDFHVGNLLGGMDISADGSYLLVVDKQPVSGSPYGGDAVFTIHKVDTATGAVTEFPKSFFGIEGPFYDVALFADGTAIATTTLRGSGGTDVYKLNTITGAYSLLSSAMPQAGIVSASADRLHVLLTPGFNVGSLLATYDLTAEGVVKQVATAGGSSSGYSVHALSGDDNLVAYLDYFNNSRDVKIYDGHLNLVLDLTTQHSEIANGYGIYPTGLAFDEGANNLFVLMSTGNIVQFSTADWSVVHTIAVGQSLPDLTGHYSNGNNLTVGPDNQFFSIIVIDQLLHVDNPWAPTPTQGNDAADTLAGTDGNDLLYGLGGNDSLSGGAGNDTLRGGDGDDLLDGGTGHDVMYGGDGNDVYIVDNSSDIVGEASATGGIDEVRASASFVLPGNVELLTLTGSAAINGTGNAIANSITGNDSANILSGMGGDDTLIGNGGDDLLDGGTGADHMAGGLGNDVYVVDNVGDVVTELVGEGIDEIRVSLASFSLSAAALANVENLTGLLNTGQTLTGNAADNVIKGNNGTDVIDGGAGADTLIGARGSDIYYVDNAGDVVVENTNEGIDTVYTNLASYTLGANVERLTGMSDTGQALSGNALVNFIVGGAGNDILDGGAGPDRLYGGIGNDTYYVDQQAELVFENPGEGTDRVATTVSWAMAAGQEIEQLTVADIASTNAVNLTGNEFANKLAGNEGANTLNGGGGNDKLAGAGGNDILDGGTGADQMQGGTGSDSYIVDNVGDTVFEANSGGVDYDTVMTTVSWALGTGQEVERLRAAPGTNPINLTGNDYAQKMQGNEGDNILTGGGGNDGLIGGGGADVLIGGTGLDKLTGGLGADTFVFEHGGQMDQIVDFAVGTDKADLTAFGLTWQDVQAAMTESNGNTILTLGGGDSVIFAGVSEASLSASDFLLGGNILGNPLQSDMWDGGRDDMLHAQIHTPHAMFEWHML
ncbi:MAG: hypothetical protein ABIS51_07650 [Sphingomonas sp.]